MSVELPKGKAIWTTDYSDDGMAYVPARRVLREGYAADSSQVYYGQPAKRGPGIEEAVKALAR